MLCTFYGGYCSLWPNRTARSLSRAWPSLLRAHNHIGGATAVPLHRKKCLLCSVLIYIVLASDSLQSLGGTEFLFINLESQLRLVAEVTGNSLSALLDSHPYHVHTHICLCLRTLGVYIMIVNLTFSHCFNVF